jgi:hypothetical protein
MNAKTLTHKPAKISIQRKRAEPPSEQSWEVALWFALQGFSAVYRERASTVRYLLGLGRRVSDVEDKDQHRITAVECSDTEQQHIYTVEIANTAKLDEVMK